MKKVTSLLLLIVFISMNVMSQTYMTYHFEQHKFGDDIAILEMLDNWHQKYGVSYKSGAFQLFDVDPSITDKTTHRIDWYGDINNWGPAETNPEQELAFGNIFFRMNSLVADYTHHESGRALYSDGNSFDNYPYRMVYRMTIDDLDTYIEAFSQLMESEEMIAIKGERPAMMGQTISGVNDGKAYWSYLGFFDREDFMRVTLETQNTEAFKKFISTVSDIRTVEETRGETLIKSWN